MTSKVMQPGIRMVDGVGLTSLPDHSVVAAAGYSAESLYIGGLYGTNRTTIERAWAAGLVVKLNYERQASAAKGGYPAGERAAKEAISDARKLGFEGDCPLIFSAADEHFSDIAGAGLDYHRALVDVFTPIGWTGGAYGFRQMLALLSEQDWWPDTWPLWHWGGDGSFRYPWAWAKQGPGGSYFDSTINRQVDNNVLLKPMPFWTGYGHIIPQEERFMAALTDDEQRELLTKTRELHVAMFERNRPNTFEGHSVESAVLATVEGVKNLPGQINTGGGSNGASADQVADELGRRLGRDA